MKNNNTVGTSGAGIGFSGLLTIVFITLKLCKVINWSWVWVLSPIWFSMIITLVIILITITGLKLLNKKNKK